jgi:hypothetical protein
MWFCHVAFGLYGKRVKADRVKKRMEMEMKHGIGVLVAANMKMAVFWCSSVEGRPDDGGSKHL